MDIFEKLSKNIKIAQSLAGIELPNGVQVSGIHYHGTSIADDPIDELTGEYSEWDTIWVTSDENVAEKFSDHGNGVQAVFEVQVNLLNALPIDHQVYTEIKYESDEFEDIRMAIPAIEMEGYDGWITLGSIGSIMYEDIAIFGSRIPVSKMKIKTPEGWTEYFPLDEFESRTGKKMKSDELDRFVRVMHP